MKEAQFYERLTDDNVKCLLCPHFCHIPVNKTGICKVRENKKGTLITNVYNRLAAIHTDPIEKKPLYHFYPGSKIVSIGEVGCNFVCIFCQNYSISQCSAEGFKRFLDFSPKQVTDHALSSEGNIGVAYTYNEPITFFEYMFDCSVLVALGGMKNVVVSNGYINRDPLEKILPFVDAFNIDLKAFNDDFYRIYAKASLSPVLDSLKRIVGANKHLEITFLAITGVNDNQDEFKNMVSWIAETLGEKVPLHISRYFPSYKMSNPPTPFSKLENLYEIAKGSLKYVYLGNVADEHRSSTFCPECGKLLVRREYYSVKKEALVGSQCGYCSTETGIVV